MQSIIHVRFDEVHHWNDCVQSRLIKDKVKQEFVYFQMITKRRKERIVKINKYKIYLIIMSN
jgi:hypothetical protein